MPEVLPESALEESRCSPSSSPEKEQLSNSLETTLSSLEAGRPKLLILQTIPP